MARPFDSFNDAAPGAVVITVTHAGRDYPEGLTDRLAVPFAQVRALEDRFADHLVEIAIAAGHRTLIARTPRLLIDLNRAETDFVAAAITGVRTPFPRPTHRARGGLGLIPERLGNTSLWRTPLRASELAERIVGVHRPWHTAVGQALMTASVQHGSAVLIDIHSMPPLVGTHPAQIVIGDRHGTSARPEVTGQAVELFRRAGLKVAVNAPYAGAYTLERHGRPAQGVSALQIEVDRRLYLDPAFDRPGSNLATMQRLIAALADIFAAPGNRADWPLAAE